MSQFHFRLFIAGDTPRSQEAIENLRRLCADFRDQPAYDVVDVLLDPETAETERILTTPTLVKTAPPPARRVTGDLSNRDALRRGLALYGELRPPATELGR
jgi:circadian clock protein KaiB